MQLLEAEENTRIAPEADEVIFRRPSLEDGKAVQDLVASCATLDDNSLYCNFLQCTHFADTCMLVEQGDKVLGWISAYRPPREPGTLFVWQVAVAETWRGHGLAGRMLDALIQRPELSAIRFLETSITPANEASANLFRRFADKRQASLTTSVLFSQAEHFAGRHDDEVLFRIGPFGPQQGLSQ